MHLTTVGRAIFSGPCRVPCLSTVDVRLPSHRSAGGGGARVEQQRSSAQSESETKNQLHSKLQETDKKKEKEGEIRK